MISAVTRISDKTNRLQSLCVNKQQVKDESIKDTLMDLANYAIMTLIELEED
ncbi:nucleotide modification associated domain-containing protein [Peptoanaerobacter stomatis]|uniref:nucleotide modification associated domain-containing protein n=1 Tax=Peptoanaerobacter stomatis TaxID=796937 RepID=UPI000319DAA8